jgi:hypothetical protein
MNRTMLPCRRLIAYAFATSLMVGCRTPPDVTLSVSLPKADEPRIAWLDIGAYPDVSCKTALRLSQGGFPEAGLSARVSIPKGNLEPALGEIPKRYHSIVVLARTAECKTVAAGCVEGDTSSKRDFAVRVDTLPEEISCDRGLSCVQGRCSPRTTGANCSLALLGTSPLTPQVFGSDQQPTYVATSPAITAVKSGFIAAYAEFDAQKIPTTSLLSAQYIGLSGGAGPVATAILKQRCVDSPQKDGIAIVTNGTNVVTGLSETQCTPDKKFVGAMSLVRFAVDETNPAAPVIAKGVLGGSFTLATAPAGEVIGMGPRFLATKVGTNDYWVAELRDRVPSLWQTTAINYPPRPEVGRIGTATTGAYANVVASAEAVLVAAINTDNNANLLSVNLIEPARLPAGGMTPPPELAVNLLKTPTSAGWVSSAIAGKRGYVVHNGSSSNQVVVRGFELGVAGESVPPITLLISKGRGETDAPVRYADIAIAGSRLFVVSGLTGDVVLTVIDLQSTNGAPIASGVRSVFLSDLRPQVVKSVREGRVAIAATDTRVGLVWLTGTTISRQEPLGSYAVFACEP